MNRCFKASAPGIEVEWTRNGTTQLIHVLRTEMKNGQVKADVLRDYCELRMKIEFTDSFADIAVDIATPDCDISGFWHSVPQSARYA